MEDSPFFVMFLDLYQIAAQFSKIFDMSEKTRLKELLTVNGMTEAQIVRDLLLSNGIMAQLEYEPIASVLGINIGDIGAVKIMVSEEDFDDAREVLKSAGKFDRD